jgi:hypothetical protein
MQKGGGRHLAGKGVLWIACCLMAAGCAAIGPMAGTALQPQAASISFESIDGPPPDIEQSLLASLNEEAAAHRIAVLPTGSAAAYRIRGYLAAHPEGRGTTISWAWDVYDGELNRALRLGGAERAAARKGWAAADEATLRRLAHAGIEQLAGLMAAAPATGAGEGSPSPPRPSRPVVAAR